MTSKLDLLRTMSTDAVKLEMMLAERLPAVTA
jgi:hypothetical protein